MADDAKGWVFVVSSAFRILMSRRISPGNRTVFAVIAARQVWTPSTLPVRRCLEVENGEPPFDLYMDWSPIHVHDHSNGILSSA